MFSPSDRGGPQTPFHRPGRALSRSTPTIQWTSTFRFTPEMRWMWPKRNDGIPGPDWVASKLPSAAATTPSTWIIPTSAAHHHPHRHARHPGPLPGAPAGPSAGAASALRPQTRRRGANARLFPLLMAVGTNPESATNKALGEALAQLNDSIPALYKSHAGALRQTRRRNHLHRNARQGLERRLPVGRRLHRAVEGARIRQQPDRARRRLLLPAATRRAPASAGSLAATRSTRSTPSTASATSPSPAPSSSS
jgi:hypothetical protein